MIVLSMQSSEDVAGSTLLQIMDRFALNNHNKSQMVTSENIGTKTLCVCTCGYSVTRSTDIHYKCFPFSKKHR